MSRPGTASLPVRPVSASTWSRAISGNHYTGHGASAKRGVGGDVLADPAPQSPPKMAAKDAHAAQAKLEQAKVNAQQKTMERLQAGSIAQMNVNTRRPGTASSCRPGSSRPGTGSRHALPGLNAAAGQPSPAAGSHQPPPSHSASAGAPPQPESHAAMIPEERDPGRGAGSLPEPTAKPRETPGDDAKKESLQRYLESSGVSTVYDPNEDGDSETSAPPAVAAPTFNMDLSDMRNFLMQPGPKNRPIQCYITRDRSQSKMYPKYSLVMGDNDQFMLSARKRKKSKTSNYIISLDEDDTSRNSGNYFGKVRSNFVGTEFTIFDKGSKPGKGDSTIGVSQMSTRSELGAVLYQYNIMGVRGPRKMTAMIPKLDDNGRRRLFRANDDEDDDGSDDGKLIGGSKDHKDGTMVASFKQGNEDDMIVMKNKTPKWNDSLGAYCLNFNGRVTHASVKNFQLIADDEEHVILQFGKVGKDTFTMDYAWPICAMQAFSICLTSFDNKLACE